MSRHASARSSRNHAKTRIFKAFDQYGINPLFKVGAIQPTKGRGGARNVRGLSTEALTERQCRELVEAMQHAERIGHPFNRFLTITWERSGIDPRDNARAAGRFIKMASDWMRARGCRLRWAWVQESSNRFGAHVHMLLHVSPDLEPLFGPMPTRWVRRIVEAGYVGKTTQSQRVPYPLNAGDLASLDAYRAEVAGKVHYMLKAAPAALEARLGLLGAGPKPWGKSCRVFGKRLAIWQGWRTDPGG
ncbi:hypothetical protein J2Y54_003134 [Sphingomonas sp. BE123]|uniref:rolling circle replication-associated protein n=1 Tax=Sphingomonas sp. BE123 TaxID=2817842 RepID=UPI002863567D|nr:hypothetical protein [Sphingomonas sp. BE123]MDR6853614.1 hypothetical protein [Sphingomonas sp. BE123]